MFFCFKIEPVKKLKELWESQVALITTPKPFELHKTTDPKASAFKSSTKGTSEGLLAKSGPSTKKWSSMQNVMDGGPRKSADDSFPNPNETFENASNSLQPNNKLEYLMVFNDEGPSLTKSFKENKRISCSTDHLNNTAMSLPENGMRRNGAKSSAKPNKPFSFSIAKLKSIDDVRSSMSDVLREIRNREPLLASSRVVEKEDKPARQRDPSGAGAPPPFFKSISQSPPLQPSRSNMASGSTHEDEMLGRNSEDNDRLVQKLKQKFDNKDHSFIKVTKRAFFVP